MSEILRVENISYQYSHRYVALNNVSASFNAGEMVAILGSNGAGKSTFLLCCNGVLRPQSGEIYYQGQKISDSKKDIYTLRQAVGLVFQDPDSQIIAGTVESEVSFGPMNLRLSQEEVEKRVDQALVQMDIVRYRDYAPHYLSGGEKKRVSIADILAMQPELILLDEPTASLDPQNIDALEEILHGLRNEGITIVLSTHDANFAYRIAQRAIVFAQGEIIADASVDEVFSQTETLRRAGLKKPLLFEVYESMQKSSTALESEKKPRTIEEFKNFVGV
ncbi:MAG: energy-coupling factor ABC transporter ATP-binding protein [Oscillospiraceae bacterium]|nr:energy-coupling factor ABC transporter ATP-binding protein [Oscillospiraceae bacterium]